MRKKNVVVVMLTQRVSHIAESRAGGSILESVVTQILFPNSKNTAAELRPLNLSDREEAFLSASPAGGRMALVRTGHGSTVVDFDLSALGPLLDVLGAGRMAAEDSTAIPSSSRRQSDAEDRRSPGACRSARQLRELHRTHVAVRLQLGTDQCQAGGRPMIRRFPHRHGRCSLVSVAGRRCGPRAGHARDRRGVGHAGDRPARPDAAGLRGADGPAREPAEAAREHDGRQGDQPHPQRCCRTGCPSGGRQPVLDHDGCDNRLGDTRQLVRPDGAHGRTEVDLRSRRRVHLPVIAHPAGPRPSRRKPVPGSRQSRRPRTPMRGRTPPWDG